MYTEVTLIVDGAVEESETFTDETLMRERIEEWREEAEGDGYPTQVFVLRHEHDIDQADCFCIQYVQDHKPYAEWNVTP